MGLMMRDRKAVTREVAKRYQKASKKHKGMILNEFVALTNGQNGVRSIFLAY